MSTAVPWSIFMGLPPQQMVSGETKISQRRGSSALTFLSLRLGPQALHPSLQRTAAERTPEAGPHGKWHADPSSPTTLASARFWFCVCLLWTSVIQSVKNEETAAQNEICRRLWSVSSGGPTTFPVASKGGEGGRVKLIGGLPGTGSTCNWLGHHCCSY